MSAIPSMVKGVPRSVAWLAVWLAAAPAVRATVLWKAGNDDAISLTSSWWTTEAGTASPSAIGATDTLRFGGSGQGSDRTLSLGGDLTVGALRLDNNTGTPNYNVTILAGQTLTLNGNTDYSGTSGLVQNSAAGGTLTIGADILVNAAQQWVTSRALTIDGAVGLGANSLTLWSAGASTGLLTINGQVSGSKPAGSNAILLTGNGKARLANAANDFTGNIEFTGGSATILEFTSAGALGNADSIRFRNTGGTVHAGSVLRYIGTTDDTVTRNLQCDTSIGMRFESDSAGGSITYSANGTWTQNGARPYTFGGTGAGNNTFAMSMPAGGAALRKDGVGKWILTGTNLYTGATTVAAGTLEIGGAGLLGASGVYSSPITNAGTLRFNSSANQTLSGVVTGAGVLAKGNVGTLTINANNTFAGTVAIGGGTVVVNPGKSLAWAGATRAGVDSLVISGGATLAMPAWGGWGATGPLGMLNYNDGYLAVNGGSIRLTASDVSGANRGVRLDAGGAVLEAPAGVDWAFGDGGNTIHGSGTLTLEGDGGGTVATRITTSGGVVKAGSGLWNLTGANSYAGATAVSNGTLLVNGRYTGGGLITVYAGGRFGGTGSVAGVSVAGGTYAPGNSPGIQTNASLAMDAGTLAIDLWGAGGAGAADGHDRVVLEGGALTLTGAPVIEVDLNGAYAPGIGALFTIVEGAGSRSGEFASGVNVVNAPAEFSGRSFEVLYDAGEVSLTVVPEPGTLGAACLGGLIALLLPRRARA